jgi:hypothetical protein
MQMLDSKGSSGGAPSQKNDKPAANTVEIDDSFDDMDDDLPF